MYILPHLRHGEAIAEDMYKEKAKLDPNFSGKWLMKHPDQPERKEPASRKVLGLNLIQLLGFALTQDWILMKCFDSRIETQDSESETEFELSQSVSLEGTASASALPLGLYWSLHVQSRDDNRTKSSTLSPPNVHELQATSPSNCS